MITFPFKIAILDNPDWNKQSYKSVSNKVQWTNLDHGLVPERHLKYVFNPSACAAIKDLVDPSAWAAFKGRAQNSV